VYTYNIANAIVFTGRLPTNMSNILPTIHVTY